MEGHNKIVLYSTVLYCSCHMRGNREGEVGAAFSQLWGRVTVDGAPKASARTEMSSLCIFSFRFYR